MSEKKKRTAKHWTDKGYASPSEVVASLRQVADDIERGHGESQNVLMKYHCNLWWKHKGQDYA